MNPIKIWQAKNTVLLFLIKYGNEIKFDHLTFDLFEKKM